MGMLDSRILQVASPFDRKTLAAFESTCEVVQFNSLPNRRDLVRLAEFMERHPAVALRAYGGYDGSLDDLEFLEFFPRLTRFHADALRYRRFTGIEGLRFLPDTVVDLRLGQTGRKFSLLPIKRFASLERLYLEGPWKDMEVISSFSLLNDLTLRSVTLPDLSLLVPLRHLRSLDLKLGGTKDLSLLPELASLRYLELWMIRGLDDIEPVAELESLQHLFLQDLARVDRLPDMRRMSSLRRVHIQNLKSLTDLAPLLDAPALEELEVYQCRQLTPEHFECLVGHPTLTHIAVGLGSLKKNEAVGKMLPLPRPKRFVFR